MAVAIMLIDSSEGRIMKRLFQKFILVLAMCLLMSPITSFAAANTGEMGKFPNVTLSPDGSQRAWTTDLGDKTNERLEREYTVDMHVESSLGNLGAGEHYYGKQAIGSVRIGKWVVKHSPGQCIHGPTVTPDTFAGFTYSNDLCHSYYNNGWFAYCADCGDLIAHMLIYARESTVRQITSMPASSIYVYLCPHCTHLEQGTSYQHYCKAISSNRYRVTYRPNAPEDSTVSGYMAPTMHMYNNSATYNGEPVSAIGYTDKALRENCYTSTGYIFIGWNTKPDGSGQSFSDKQSVINLTTEEDGIVKLYAQWRKAENSLMIDAAGGTYKGNAVYEQKQKYGTSYKVDSKLLVPPTGYTVSFQTNGGSAVPSITTTKSFSHWEIQSGFAGEFKNNVYRFIAENGHKDRIEAQYVNDSFKLPDCQGSNASLVGWYDDPGLSDEAFVGKPGDKITVNENKVLYAKWATLTLWAYDDYDSHDGVGAVDLKWEQVDGKSKFYRLYQSEDKANWKEIFTGSSIENNFSISKEYGIGKQGTTYKISYTGNYTLTAYGAKGANYNSTYTGGKGGKVTATYWLEKGDEITVYPGKVGSGVNGGTNGNGANGGSSSSDYGRGGGAATEIYLTRDGVKVLLITAGGGGGANAGNSGGNGGTGGGNTTSVGSNGVGAGGGGYSGGLCGEFSYHSHSNACGYHTHTGNSTSGGGCYTKKVTQSVYCGETEEYDQGPCSWWWDDANNRCIRCHGTDPGNIHTADRCKNCGKDCSPGSHYVTKTTYSRTCGVSEGYQCGKTASTIESFKASVGGTSYATEGYGKKNASFVSGANDGAGKVTIESQDIGYLETTNLNNVLAKDKSAPGAIKNYVETLSGEDVCRITVEAPDDFGTLYYHKAESYASGTIKKLVDSNITENTLISGIAGYRYYVDGSSTGKVTDAHTLIYTNKVDVEMQSDPRYLHIAAVDVAGNIGPTKIIVVKAKDDSGEIEIEEEYLEDVPLKTEQLMLADTDFVYGIGNNTFYVKADGETEHLMTVGGYVDGKATDGYQVDWLKVITSSATTEEWYQTRIPKVDIAAGDKTFANMQLATDASKEDLTLWIPTSAEAKRVNQAIYVSVSQRFVMNPAVDGKQIVVYPEAIAELEEEYFYSDRVEDRQNAITLIPDGKAPTIAGLDALEGAGNIDMTEASKSFVIRATDTGSGIRSLSVTIINQDNQMRRTYASASGEVTIIMDKEDYLFLGDFAVTAEAVDNVGNVNHHESDNLAFTLKADIQRSRFPHNGTFKAGDGAVLTVVTGGYAEKVIIRFPEELLRLNPDLNREYNYEFPEALKTEVYEFNIPLSTPNGNYVIEVEAWKDGRKLTEELALPVRTVGSIIEEFRTRIRDNGV